MANPTELRAQAEAEVARLRRELADWEASFAVYDGAVRRGTAMMRERGKRQK